MGPAQSLAGPDYQIFHDLGTIKGQNLFHSFHDFSIAQGESATFIGPDSIANVISRVTGGEVSSIDGILRSQVGKADFFFINPAGVVFGPNAQVDVPGAFHVTTADELRFFDGNVFSSSNPDVSSLTMAKPASFGFLSPQSASIVLNGAKLIFAPETTIGLAGGDVSMIGSEIGEAALSSQGGEIRVRAVGGVRGEVPISENADFDMQGNIQLESADITTSGNKGGKITIQAGDMNINSAMIAADNTGPDNPNGGIELLIGGDFTISHGSRVQSNVFDKGNSEKIQVKADNILIEQIGDEPLTGIFSEVETGAEGDAGGIVINTLDDLQIKGIGQITSSTDGVGHAGDVQVNAMNIVVDGQGRSIPYRENESIAGISSETWSESTGDAGKVMIDVANHLYLLNSGAVSGSTNGAGSAGDVLVNAGILTIDSQDSGWFTGFSSEPEFGATGHAGSVDIKVDGMLAVLNGGLISSGTYSESDAGNVKISAGSLHINGQNSEWFTGISSQANSELAGHSGSIAIEVNELLEILNGASISSDTYSESDAGDVKISAGSLHINGQNSEWFTGISSQANLELGGHAGNIEVNVNEMLEILNGAIISSDTYSGGDAGEVIINAGTLTIDRQNSDSVTGIFSDANSGSTGNAGKVEIMTDELLEILNGGQISSDIFSGGDAGEVIINAGTLTIDRQNSDSVTGIFSDANSESTGNAGRVEVNVCELLEILNGGQISSDTFYRGDAGEVIVNAGSLTIDRQSSDSLTGIFSIAKSGSAGSAGSVEIRVDTLLEILNGGQISSDTFSKGNAGVILINAGTLSIDRQKSDSVTGIFSDTNSGATGNAGGVEVTVADLLTILNGARISSITFSEGNAGKVIINTGNLSIDGQGSDFVTGILSQADPESRGDAGSVEVTVEDLFQIVNGGTIASSTFSEGNAGKIVINTGRLTMDRQGSDSVTGIFSDANSGATGDAGGVEVTIADLLKILNGARISSYTFSGGNAGEVIVNAGSLSINRQNSDAVTGILSDTISGSTGNAGRVEVDVSELLEILNGGQISSGTFSQGNAGEVIVNAGTLTIDKQDTYVDTGIFSGTKYGSTGYAGKVNITVSELLQILNGGQISTSTWSDGDAGNVKIRVKDLKIDSLNSYLFTGIFSQSDNSYSKGNAGIVEVYVNGKLEIIGDAAYISSATFGQGKGGEVVVHAESLLIDAHSGGGGGGIKSATAGSGDAGTVDIDVNGLIELLNGGVVYNSTFSEGDAGDVTIHAGEIRISGAGYYNSGFQSDTRGKGYAGIVDVSADGCFEILNGAQISSSTWSEGHAGSVVINAGELTIDSQGSEFLTGIFSQANPGSGGNAGGVEVNVGRKLEILGNAAYISNESFDQGKGGEVVVHADSLLIDAKDGEGAIRSATAGSGDAGTVDIDVNGLMELLDGGVVYNSTFSEGDAGDVTIHAGEIRISGAGYYSDVEHYYSGFQSNTYGKGDAGIVNVSADGCFEILNGAEISSSTWSEGHADSVVVNAGELTIDSQGSEFLTGIFSQANPESNGSVGNISILANQMKILNNGAISIASWNSNSDINTENMTEPQERFINIDVNGLLLDQYARITAESSGSIPAAAIELNVSELVVENGSSITTSAQDANGGPITIQSNTMILRDGHITTSVHGEYGNGGTIVLTGQRSNPDPKISLENLDNRIDIIVFDGGFVQANTAAQDAHGGDILINARAVIASGNELLVGGEEKIAFEPGQGLNVIQAAAPGGEQGTIDITAPELDINGSLVKTGINFFQPARLATDPCSVAGGQGISSLIFGGQGGLPGFPEQPLGIFFDEERVDRLLEKNKEKTF